MANSPMTRTQFSSSLIAGAVAHTMFQTGWFGFGMSLAGLAADDGRVARMSRAGHQGYPRLCNTVPSWSGAIIEHYRAVLAQATMRHAA